VFSQVLYVQDFLGNNGTFWTDRMTSEDWQ